MTDKETTAVETPATPATPPAVAPAETPTAATPDTTPTPAAETTPAPETTPASETTPTPETTPAPETTPEPEAAAERVIPAVDKYVLPEGVPTNVAQFAFDNNMTQEQLDGTLKQFSTYMQGADKAEKAVIRREGNELVESWGSQKKGNLSIVYRALDQNDPDGELKKVLDSTGFGNHPAVINYFLRVGNSMKEGGFLKSDINTTKPGGVSAANAMFGKSHPSAN